MKNDSLSCFVIMPISDNNDYGNGHFQRVYEHIVKPACIKSGFVPTRADEQTKTNYIVIDILRNIIDSDMVICDLSSKNPNVLYELGIRQAFNKKVVLIKDKITDKIFDIQGLRYIEYDESLRIDSVLKNVEEIAKTLNDTYKSDTNDINSLIQLLSINPAKITNSVDLSNETSIILKAISELNDRINSLESKGNDYEIITPISTTVRRTKYKINNMNVSLGENLYIDGGEIGKFIEYQKNGILVKKQNEDIALYKFTDPDFKNITVVPF